MKFETKSMAITAIGLLTSAILFTSASKPTTSVTKAKPKIQVAILLDVSGSMDGLIEQAKAQLWNMVSTLGKANVNKVSPDIEIALYEYGRTTNPVSAGYVKQINGFTTDLDQVSKNLFQLSTDGGDEFCGQVIHTSLDELGWDASPSNYKVIFIAGNEDFLQGNLHYTKACAEANKKGVIVNTIYCGDRMEGIRLHWNLNAECGQGSYTNINHNDKIEEIATPYDSLLFVMNQKFNSTYLSYGHGGQASAARQNEVDAMNQGMSASVMAKRVAAKGQKSVYRNETWDLVDAMDSDPNIVSRVDRSTLTDSLRSKTAEELKAVIIEQKQMRGTVSKEIEELNKKRDAYIQAKRARSATDKNKATLESEVERIIRQQAGRFNVVID